MKKKKPIICINPPPRDERCECCRRYISKLKPFGKAGDPLVGDFDGALLLKTFRPMGIAKGKDKKRVKRFEKIWDMQLKGKITEKEREELHKKEFPGKEYEGYDMLSHICGTIGASWECRDCIILHGEEYFKKKNETYHKK